MGRPPAGDKPRQVDVRCRVTPEEKTRFAAAAARDGMDLSSWLRWLAELQTSKPRKPPKS